MQNQDGWYKWMPPYDQLKMGYGNSALGIRWKTKIWFKCFELHLFPTLNCEFHEIINIYRLDHSKGISTQKSLGHDGSWESLNSHSLRVSLALVLGLHAGSFEAQPKTSSMTLKSTWNPTWQVWIMLSKIVKMFWGMALKLRLDEIYSGNMGLH